MKKQNVEQIIKEIATENFNLYPDSYPIKNGLATDESSENVSDLAQSYWDNRSEMDIDRDDDNNVSLIDYVDWAHEAFAIWVQNQIEA